MMREEQRLVPDLTLALGTLMLLAIGLVLIYSSSAILAMGRSGDSFYYINRQLVFAAAGVLALISGSMLFCAGLSPSLFVWPALAGIPALALIVLHSAYRMRRVEVFLDPWKDPGGKGFQIVHSMMAFGTGGLLGQGLGQGKQK